MKLILAITAALMLAACATPADLRATAKPVTQWSGQNARDHANCLARRMTNVGAIVTLLPGPQPESHEITVRAPRALGATAVVIVSPATAGSTAVYYVAPDLDGQNMASVFAKAC